LDVVDFKYAPNFGEPQHMEERHPAYKPAKHGEDLRLTFDDANFLKSAGITPWK
jgi:hypothetical protein